MIDEELLRKRFKIERKIEKLQTELQSLKLECKHRGAKKTHHSNTGNYDPTADCYWTNFNCPVCGEKWSEEGSK